MNCECRDKNRVIRGDCCKKTLSHPEFGEFLCSCLHGDVKSTVEDGDSLADRMVQVFLKLSFLCFACYERFLLILLLITLCSRYFPILAHMVLSLQQHLCTKKPRSSKKMVSLLQEDLLPFLVGMLIF